MFNKVKLALRITSGAFDNEITDIIAAARKDLGLVGVLNPNEVDPLIERAIILYAKAHFGYDETSEKYQAAYDHLKCTLSLAGEYIAVQ